ncbi:MAG TPA: homocysteine S-methyltransferase family protein [Ignavibacteriaceae bacterium]|nr:homocysteine S-methyltransferase family protein [Ignavibacteriaceae bacterium]
MNEEANNPFFIARRNKVPLILDGAMGSLLQNQGWATDNKLWMSYMNLSNPDVVLKAHKQYVESGADIITTNTFRTNPAAVKGTDLDGEHLVRMAVQIAREAIEDNPVFLAGSNPPAEDCYKIQRDLSLNELIYNHQKHIDYLYSAGCDFILNETMSHSDELKIICQHCNRNNIPFVVSLFFNDDLRLLSGEKVVDVVDFILHYRPLAVGFNCIKPGRFEMLAQKLNFDFDWGLYLNCGKSEYDNNDINESITPDDYITNTKKYLDRNPSFIGSCCGSSPSHTLKLKELFNERYKS